MNKKIIIVLVTYNPDIDNLMRTIKILLGQSYNLVICNNSTFDLNFKIDNIKIFNFNENLGIAKAQSIGMEWAFKNGADFILQMDQDSVPSDTLVEDLLQCYTEMTELGLKVGLVGPQDFDIDTKELNKARINKGKSIVKDSYISMQNTLSSGSLISKEIYEIIGVMDDSLFIDAVDSEYCWRIRKAGFLVIKNNNALLGHKLGDGKKKILGFINVGVSAPIRNYYQVRNVFLLLPKSYVPIYWKLSQLIKVFFKILFFPFTLDQGRSRFKYLWRGFFDGVLRISGKYDYK